MDRGVPPKPTISAGPDLKDDPTCDDDGVRVRWVQLAIAAAGIGFGAATEAIQIGLGVDPERILIDFVVGQTYLLGGTFAWGRQPSNRTWLLMIGVGFGWFVGNLAGSTNPALHAIGIVLADLDSIFLTALILAYPFGTIDGRAHRLVVATAAVGLTAANVLYYVTGTLAPNLIIGLSVTAALAILVPRRWWLAQPRLRRILGPAVLAISVTLLAVGIGIAIRLIGIRDEASSLLLSMRDIGVLAIPIGFVVGSFQLVEEELRMSRARIVEATDAERRRLERDLHDGAQQRFVSLSIALRLLHARLGPDVSPEVARSMESASEELKAGIAELRELAHGIHPAVLTGEGLPGALAAIAERSSVAIDVTCPTDRRFDPAVEATAYFVASEALANIEKHASASRAWITVSVEGDRLRLQIRDDGQGGVDVSKGSGIVGLADRVSAVGGRLEVASRPGHGTTIEAVIPLGVERPAPRTTGAAGDVGITLSSDAPGADTMTR
jgi:signal transduction histidine kinase